MIIGSSFHEERLFPYSAYIIRCGGIQDFCCRLDQWDHVIRLSRKERDEKTEPLSRPLLIPSSIHVLHCPVARASCRLRESTFLSSQHQRKTCNKQHSVDRDGTVQDSLIRGTVCCSATSCRTSRTGRRRNRFWLDIWCIVKAHCSFITSHWSKPVHKDC